MSTRKSSKKNESKKSKNKQNQRLQQLFVQLGLGALSVILLLAAFNDVRTYQGLRESLGANRRLLAKTKEEEEQLELTKRNLTNPDYLEFVARGRYYASRPGEQVFVFPQLAQEYSQADDDFYDDELLREEEANKKQSLQEATKPSTPSQNPEDSQESQLPQEDLTSQNPEEDLTQSLSPDQVEPSLEVPTEGPTDISLEESIEE